MSELFEYYQAREANPSVAYLEHMMTLMWESISSENKCISLWWQQEWSAAMSNMERQVTMDVLRCTLYAIDRFLRTWGDAFTIIRFAVHAKLMSLNKEPRNDPSVTLSNLALVDE